MGHRMKEVQFWIMATARFQQRILFGFDVSEFGPQLAASGFRDVEQDSAEFRGREQTEALAVVNTGPRPGMIGSTPLVVLDACVLANFSLCDTLLRLAEPPRLFEPKWSDEIIR